MQFIKNKIISALLIFALILVTFGISPKTTSAAALVNAKDTMSTQATSATATHIFTYTMATGHSFAAADTIAFDFAEADFTLNAIGNWQVADFAFNDGSARTINAVSTVSGTPPSCAAGNNNVCVTINTTTSTFTVFAASTYTTSGTGAAVTFTVYGTTGTGTGTVTNKASNVESSLITITDTGTNTDSTTLAAVVETNDIVTVSASVNPTLTLAISANTVALNTITSSSTGAGSHTAQIATNATGGFLLTYNGITLTATSGTIPAYGSQASSVQGTAGFGINMVSNATPAIGANVTQNAGVCAALPADYGTTNKYSYVASTTTPLTNQAAPADCTYTISYVANVSNVTPAGSYTAPITYVASGTF